MFLLAVLLTAQLWAVSGAASMQASDTSITIAGLVKNTSSLENIAVRHNGDILVTSVASSTIFQISSTGAYDPITIGQIPNLNATLGIVELEEDIFYIAACNLSGLSGANNELWRLDMRISQINRRGTVVQPAQLSHVAKVPQAKLLNGMTRLAPNDNTNILAADSSAGKIYKIDVFTGTSMVALHHPTMATSPKGLGIGVNGIHTLGNDLYYTSLDRMLFARIPISLLNGTAIGPVDIISNGTLKAADDFVLSPDATRAWVAENGRNVIVEVDIISRTTRIAANSTFLTSLSSAALSRTCEGNTVLYTSGSLLVNGTATWGQVTRVEFPA